jgi:hypothetical protein
LALNKIILNVCGHREHVPEIERKNRTVKEQVQGILLPLPFKKLPKELMVDVVVFAVMWLNFLLQKGGLLATVLS